MEKSIVDAITRIAAQNLANAIFGGGQGGGGGFGSFFANLFGMTGGGGGGTATMFGAGSEFPGYASGTSSARGGWSMVGERGPEMVRLPRGAQVIPNDVLKSRRAALHQTVNITVAGSTTTKTADQIAVAVGQATRRALMRNA